MVKLAVTGTSVNDPGHPDYCPSIFPSNMTAQENCSQRVQRFERAAKRCFTEENGSHPTKKLKQTCMDEDKSKEFTANFDGRGDLEEDLHEGIQPEDSVPRTSIKTPLEMTEREQLYEEISSLRHERDEALSRIASLEKLLTLTALSTSSVEGNDEACKMMTGLSWSVFMCLTTAMSALFPPVKKGSLPLKEQLFVTLLKLRHNLTFEFLAHIKGIPKTTMIDIFWKWIDMLYSKLSFTIAPTDREHIFRILPEVFKEKFPRLTSIVDCCEIFIETPQNLLARAQTYSSYKKHTTMKFFISCNPHGHINFLSKMWGGRASDVMIVRESGFMESTQHMPHDQILADRGFLLHDELATRCSAQLLTPAFTKGHSQMPGIELEGSSKVSSVRIHIERIIGLLKNRYTILKGTLPLRCVKSIKDESMEAAIASGDKIVRVCAALVNLGPSIVFK
ncbi:uncharacterized protein LOC106151628 [Lingula anatina]|uniref:Uncharacterized protein LOC106151628 n=1 Tax=Lingula anatina TaxID=7574 RepID=A0A1S3H2T9_LINAN|nr:uncharacterized protein LOC106151628 [Lingula anatina]|eukprot:XP_013380445.1 uncharacterized protein LOC106151628 [Lingula anatina]